MRFFFYLMCWFEAITCFKPINYHHSAIEYKICMDFCFDIIAAFMRMLYLPLSCCAVGE